VDTLPDYLTYGLQIVFVGINPGAYSVRVGHYFATSQNRFWSALNRSGLVHGGGELGPEDDVRMHEFGIGFTDVVKRATNSASSLRSADYRQGGPVLQKKLLVFQPMVVCFNGIMGYRNYLRYGEGTKVAPHFGAQEHVIGTSRVFVAPSPSPANAAFSLDTLAGWYRRLGEYRDCLAEPRT